MWNWLWINTFSCDHGKGLNWSLLALSSWLSGSQVRTIQWGTEVNLSEHVCSVLMSPVTLSPLSCDMDETAKAVLKDGFVLDLATP